MKLKRIIELFIFNVRWLLIVFYAKLAWDIIKLAYLSWYHPEIDPNMVMVFIEDVDTAMIANLIEMMITGGYNSFVSKDHLYKNKNISSGQLKIKMSTSIIGISSVHLLKVFIESDALTMEDIWKKTIIHGAFIVGGIALAWIDFLHCKSEVYENNNSSAPHVTSISMHTSPTKAH